MTNLTKLNNLTKMNLSFSKQNWTKLSKLKNRTNKVFNSDLKKHDSMLPLLKTEKKFE